MKIIPHSIIFYNSSLNTVFFDLHAGCGVFAPILYGFSNNSYLYVCVCMYVFLYNSAKILVAQRCQLIITSMNQLHDFHYSA